MKVRITTQYGEYEAELDEGMTVADLFITEGHSKGNTVSFTVVAGGPTRVTMLKSLIHLVEEDL